jgi:putative phage-type endonuclease
MKNETQTFDPVARKLGIGASEAAAALGLSRYKSPLDIYISKTTEYLNPQYDSPQTARGRMLEPVVLNMYEAEVATLLARNPKTITSTEYPFMFASLDAIRADDGRPVDAKTAGQYVAYEWGALGTDDVPQEYLIQVTHQMIVMKKDIGDLAALITLDDFRPFTFARDKELSEMIVEGLANFWRRVEKREAPEPMTGYEAEKLYRRSVENGVVADDATAAAYQELLSVKNAIKPLEKREAELISDIKLFMKANDTLLIDAKPVVTWKTGKSAFRLDAKRLKHEMPDIHAKFMTESEGSRPFLIKGMKNESA